MRGGAGVIVACVLGLTACAHSPVLVERQFADVRVRFETPRGGRFTLDDGRELYLSQARLTGGYLCGTSNIAGDRCLDPGRVESVLYVESRADPGATLGGLAGLVLVSPAILALAASAEAGRAAGDGTSPEERAALALLSNMQACVGPDVSAVAEALWGRRMDLSPECLGMGASWLASVGDMERARRLSYLAGARLRFEMELCSNVQTRRPWAPQAPASMLVADAPRWPQDYQAVVEDPSTYDYPITWGAGRCYDWAQTPPQDRQAAALATAVRFDLFDLPEWLFAAPAP
jgi:hypothetical protein